MILANYLPPASEFRLVEHRWAENGVPAAAYVGESACAVGWIPAYQTEDQLPAGFLREHWARDAAIPLLVGSGNQAPPERFDGPADLTRHLNTLDFRGAIAIDQPTLFTNTLGQPVMVQFLALARVGSTPVRMNRVLFYSAGVSSACGDISADRTRVVLRLFLRLKIGFGGQAVAAVMTGHWPPWATLSLEYVFNVQREHPSSHVVFGGTSVPSQRRYVGWKARSDYRLETDLSIAGYEGFVEAGGCRDALSNRWQSPIRLKKIPVVADL